MLQPIPHALNVFTRTCWFSSYTKVTNRHTRLYCAHGLSFPKVSAGKRIHTERTAEIEREKKKKKIR